MEWSRCLFCLISLVCFFTYLTEAYPKFMRTIRFPKRKADCFGKSQVCSSMLLALRRDGTVFPLPLESEGDPGVCDCENCPSRFQEDLDRSFTWFVNLDKGRKLVAQTSFCNKLPKARTCIGDEVALQTIGKDLFSGNINARNCQCRDPEKPMYQQMLVQENGYVYQNYSCEMKTCTQKEQLECARVYVNNDDNTLNVVNHCACPKYMHCPVSLDEDEVEAAYDESGWLYYRAFCRQ